MTDYFWPQHIIPNSSSWSLVANTAAFTSPLSGTTRTLGRGGDRWTCTLTFNALTTEKRAILQAFLAQLRGQANRVYVMDHSYRKRGTFPTANLLPDFASATPWTAGYSTLAVTDRIGRITALAHSGAQYPQISYAVTVTNGAMYALRAFYTRSSTGTASLGPYLTDGTNSTVSYSTAAGLKTVNQAMTGTAATCIVVIDGTGTSTAVNDFADVAYVSASRCLSVNGGSQTGSILNVASAPAAVDTLVAGDRIEVNGEYHLVTDSVGVTGSSAAAIRLARPLRSSPTNGSAVIVHDPVCKMILAGNTVGWSNSPGGISSMTVELVEDIA